MTRVEKLERKRAALIRRIERVSRQRKEDPLSVPVGAEDDLRAKVFDLNRKIRNARAEEVGS